MTRGKAEAALVANTLVWGSTFVVVKSALNDASPLLFLALRFSFATAILAVVFARRLPRLWDWPTAAAGALAGLFLFGGYAFQTVGLQFTSAPRSAFITGLCAVLVPLVAALVYRIRPQVSELAGLGVATAGMGLLTLEGATGAMNRGDLLTLLCAFSFAAHMVVLGHFSERMSFEVLSLVQIGATAALSAGLYRWAETPMLRWRPALTAAILATGLLATAAAFLVQTWALRYTTATRAGLILTLEPVFAWITSFVLAGEGLSRRGAAGAILILSGVVLVEVKPRRARQHPSK